MAGIPVSLKVTLDQARSFQRLDVCPPKEKIAKLTNFWAHSALKRAGFCSRAITSSGRIFQADPSVAEAFHRLNQAVCSGISASYILNMDEVSVHYENVPKRCFDKIGTKKVQVRTSGATKKNITVALTVSAAGDWLPAYAILKRKTIPSGLVVPNVTVSANQTSWMTGPEFIKYIRSVVLPLAWSEAPGRHVILIVDSAPAHSSCYVDQNLIQGITIVHIPKGYTSSLQPLDVGVMKPFRAKMQSCWVDRNVRLAPESGRNIPVPSHEDLLGWVSEACHSIQRDTIIKSWLKSGFNYLSVGQQSADFSDDLHQVEDEISGFHITSGDSDCEEEIEDQYSD